MKARLPTSKKAVEEAKTELTTKAYECFMMMAVSVLHTEFGFGAERINKFYNSFCRLGNAYTYKYDDSAYWALRKHLQDMGIDIEFN